jgi:ABC-2 type transport system permease protein
MKTILTIILQEYKVLLKDKQSLAVLFLMPALLILFLSLALTDIYKQKVGQKIDITVFSKTSNLNQQILKEFSNFSYTISHNTGNLDTYLESNTPTVAIMIPEEMAKILKNKSTNKKIKFYFSTKLDHSIKEMIKAHFLISVQSVIISQVNNRLQKMNEQGKNPNALSINSLIKADQYVEEISSIGRIPTPIEQTVPAWTLFAMFFIIIPISSSFIRDRQTGVLKRLQCMGVSKFTILLSKICSYLIINNIQFILMFGIGMFIVPQIIGENFTLPNINFQIVLTTLICSLCATSFGLLITSISKSSDQASTLGALSIVIMALLGGVMIPHFIMPEFMQALSIISPLYWGLDAYLDIFLNNSSLVELIPNLLVLSMFSILFFLISLKKFAWEQ